MFPSKVLSLYITPHHNNSKTMWPILEWQQQKRIISFLAPKFSLKWVALKEILYISNPNILSIYNVIYRCFLNRSSVSVPHGYLMVPHSLDRVISPKSSFFIDFKGSFEQSSSILALDIWGQIIPHSCCCLLHCRKFSIIPDVWTLVDISTSHSSCYASRHCYMSPGGHNHF